MSSQHTPGKWIMGKAAEDHLAFVATAKSQVYLADVHSYSNGIGPSRAERDANARLMAAAPELVQALKKCINLQDECLGDYPELVADLRALIAKATGAA